MRIIQYSPGMRLELGGVVRAVLDACTILARRGHEVILLTYDAPDLPGDWDGRNGKPRVVRVESASRPNGSISRAALGMAKEIMRGGGVLHLHTPWTLSNLQLARVARGLGLPYVVSLHGMLNDWPMHRSPWKKRLFLLTGGRKLLLRAASVHCTAEGEWEQSKRWIRTARPMVLPYLIDLSAFEDLPGVELAREAFGLEEQTPVLLFLSRLHEQKGVDALIDAAAKLAGGGLRFQLIIAGTGTPAYTARLREQIGGLGLDGSVRLIGMVSGAMKLSLYQAATLFVLPTRHENFGLVLAEAMACGSPVLTTRGTNIWQDIATAGGTVLADERADGLADMIGKLLRDGQALRASGEAGRAWVLGEYGVEALAPRYEGMYEKGLRDSGQV